MPEPLRVTIPHKLGRAAARARIERNLAGVRDQLAAVSASAEYGWTGDQLGFRVMALGQTVTGRVDVRDEAVEVEVDLPLLLSLLGSRLAGKITQQGTRLLTKG